MGKVDSRKFAKCRNGCRVVPPCRRLWGCKNRRNTTNSIYNDLSAPSIATTPTSTFPDNSHSFVSGETARERTIRSILRACSNAQIVPRVAKCFSRVFVINLNIGIIDSENKAVHLNDASSMRFVNITNSVEAYRTVFSGFLPCTPLKSGHAVIVDCIDNSDLATSEWNRELFHKSNYKVSQESHGEYL